MIMRSFLGRTSYLPVFINWLLGAFFFFAFSSIAAVSRENSSTTSSPQFLLYGPYNRKHAMYGVDESCDELSFYSSSSSSSSWSKLACTWILLRTCAKASSSFLSLENLPSFPINSVQQQRCPQANFFRHHRQLHVLHDRE